MYNLPATCSAGAGNMGLDGPNNFALTIFLTAPSVCFKLVKLLNQPFNHLGLQVSVHHKKGRSTVTSFAMVGRSLSPIRPTIWRTPGFRATAPGLGFWNSLADGLNSSMESSSLAVSASGAGTAGALATAVDVDSV
jgi:hypothetical protein